MMLTKLRRWALRRLRPRRSTITYYGSKLEPALYHDPVDGDMFVDLAQLADGPLGVYVWVGTSWVPMERVVDGRAD